ncbi:MAG: hypothetical protein NXH73_02865 [Flavobacteriaceae bacterium]|nr:hypothetical protein [Flavobacteriaceae bacterium]
MVDKIFATFLLLFLFTTLFSCKTTNTDEVYIDYFYKYAEKYLQEIPIESRQLNNPKMGEIKVKVYIKEVDPKKFTIHGRLETVSGINKPSDFDKICLATECYDLFLFINGEKTEKDISIFHDEFQKYSAWYPFISNHFPVWEINVSSSETEFKRIY